MNQYKRKIKRYIIAFVFLILSAFTTMVIKDTMDSIYPEDALPLINTSIGYDLVNVSRAGYSWEFGLKSVLSPYLAPPDVPMVINSVLVDTEIAINFTTPHNYIIVSCGKGLVPDEFVEVYPPYTTPSEEDIFVYKVEAFFDKGDITYYFTVHTQTSKNPFE